MTTPEIVDSAYDKALLTRQAGDLLDRHMPKPLSACEQVLIKPNLLLAAPPEKAILTHPLVVRAAAAWVLDRGGRPLIADSPAVGSVEKIWRVGGFEEALKGMPYELRSFQTADPVDIGAPFGTIGLAREALGIPTVINLPKFKTHAMMTLTLGVKNLFGCVVGFEKPKWHARAGIQREQFAKLLVGIAEAIRPTVTLVDAVTGLEGQGPGKNGTPRPMGALVAGANIHGVDAACARMAGLAPEDLPTLAAALALGHLTIIPPQPVPETVFKDFKLPTQSPVTFGPSFLKHLIRKHMVQRPVVNPATCQKCNHCLTYCPVNAITETPEAVAFNLETCIRCYCCVEVCPHAALEAVDTRIGAWLQSGKRLVDRVF
ncbi:DUF362 domain-containing protein [Desulfoluna spongiiphila]|uniref:Uncharacterized conserved protein, DUF362 family n=1 Tax=Desulfoluna spongiiphila TaxID=419481 RepID=A0A1G5HK05_9BACT|nr:DUF362 domain-containing protein [Desulfoluna spongiiphila]SCY64034.1 Uncharacterized conserved protein, DUF362 family [Desulfoluna spongiiphila]